MAAAKVANRLDLDAESRLLSKLVGRANERGAWG